MYLNCSGYSVSAQDFVRCLMQKSYPVYVEKNQHRDNFNFAGLSPYMLHMFHQMEYEKDISQTLSVWNFPPSQFETTGKINIGYTDYEVTKLPELWVKNCNKMDEIWTSSAFCKRVFLNSGVKRDIKVIPHTIDSSLWNPNVEAVDIPNKRGFTFLFVSEWMPRKGIYELLRAWYRAFKHRDDVCLILKTYLGSHRNIDAIRREIVQVRQEFNLTHDKTAPILYCPDFIEDSLMPNFFQCADVLVAPSLGEGFGLSVVQAEMMGIPVIATNWSSLVEVCNNDIGYMIDIKGLEPVSQKQIDFIPSYKDAQWAKLDEDNLIDIMRHVYNNPDELATKSKKCIDFAQQFGYQQVSNKLIRNINRVLSRNKLKDTVNIIFDKETGKIGEQYKDTVVLGRSEAQKITLDSFVNYFPGAKFVKVYINNSEYLWGKIP